MTPFDKYNFFKLTIIEDDIDSVKSNFVTYFSETADELKIKSSETIDFNLICDKPNLEYRGPFKFMLFSPLTNPSKTVFFCNLIDGWNSVVHNYAKLFRKEVYQIGLTINKKAEEFPAYFFANFNYNEKNEFIERVVHLIKEDKWIFFENSYKVLPLSIETPEYYKAKRKTDRLNNEIILEYLRKSGYDLTDKNFFETNKKVYYCKWK
jgi:hypothetical protein